MKKLNIFALAILFELFLGFYFVLPSASAQPLAACGTQRLHIEMFNVAQTWPEHDVNANHMYLWNQYMDIYRYSQTGTTWDQNDRNEFGGYPPDWQLNLLWGFNWSSSTLAMTCLKRSWWPPWENCREITESDIVFNPQWNWTLDRDFAEDNPGFIFYDSVLLHELGHSWGMLSFLEYYRYPAPTVMHAYYGNVLQDSMLIHAPDAIALRDAYASQESIPTFVNVGIHSKFADAEHQIWENSTTDKTTYAIGESITINNLTVENTGTVDLNNVHVRVFLSTDRHNISNYYALIGDWSWDVFPSESYGVYSFTGSIPSGIDPGNYYVLGVASFNGYADDGWWDNVTHLVQKIYIKPQIVYTLTVNINPAGGGSVSLSPGGGSYPSGSQVTLTANPSANYAFSSWTESGSPIGTSNPINIIMNSNRSITANFTPTCSSPNPLNNTTEFVKQQYRDFLNREADAGGLAYWVNQINTGAKTKAQVIESFFLSAEFAQKIAPIVRLYFAYFLRIPDYAGLMFWINTGWPLGAISDSFAGSSEFQQRYGSLSNGNFVTLVYQNVLGRIPDAGGYAFWTGQLNTGAMTRGQVMIGFSESAEYRSKMASEVYVTMIYIGMMRRAPDQGGFNFWVGYLDSGNSGLALINGFLNSQEYANRFQSCYALSVTGGSVGQVSGPGISCGSGGSDCSESYPKGTAVNLTATSTTTGIGFLGFSGCDSTSANTCTVTMNQNRTVTAYFDFMYILTVIKTGSGSGYVANVPSATSNYGDIDCGPVCTHTYVGIGWHNEVSLDPTADPGSVFTSFSGCDYWDPQSQWPRCYLSMYPYLGDRTVYVNFDLAP